MRKEEAPKNVPINIAFGEHRDNSSRAGINWLKNQAQNYLASAPKGKVAWVLEMADVDDATNDTIRARRDDGIKSQINSLYEGVLEAMPADRKNSIREDLKENKTFDGKIVQAATDLDRRYSNRVVLATEHKPRREAVIDRLILATDVSHKVFIMCRDGQFEEALSLFKRSVIMVAERMIKERDNIFVNVFKAEAEYPDTLAVVGHLGSSHTAVYHKLEREGYNTTRFFAEKEDGVYLYPPAVTTARMLTSFPQKDISEEQWLRALFQQTIYEALEIRRTTSLKSLLRAKLSFVGLLRNTLFLLYLQSQIPTIPKTRQGVLKFVYAATKDFDTDDIKTWTNAISHGDIFEVAGVFVKRHT